jgi:superfamily II DNA or RNA helicase
MHSNYYSSLRPGEDPDLSWCELRPYQVQCLLNIHRAERQQVRRMLVSLPTGTGKTTIFAHLPHAVHIPKRLLILAHRQELIEQAEHTLRRYNPTKRIGLEYGPHSAKPDDEIVIASLDALKHANERRLTRLDRHTISHIVYDECHHAAAKDTLHLLRRLGVFVRTDLTLIGFTATPFRTDGIQLNTLFERTVYERNLEEMIRAGWLAPIHAYRINSHVDISHVHLRRGDFDDRELETTINTPERNALIIKAYQEKGDNHPCLIFCAGVQHARNIAAQFVAKGIPAACIHGALPREERTRLIAAFKAGSIKILTNYNVLTEGFDAPATRLMILARPTTSGIVLAQSVGRVTRLDPQSGKTSATVIEIADANPNPKTLGIGSLFRLHAQFNAEGRDLLAVKDATEAMRRAFPNDIDPTRFMNATQVTDLLRHVRQRHAQSRPKPTTMPGSAHGHAASHSDKTRATQPSQTSIDDLDQLYHELELKLTPQDIFALVNHKAQKRRTPQTRPSASAEPIAHTSAAPISSADFHARLEDSDLLMKLVKPHFVTGRQFAWLRTGTSQLIISLKDRGRLEITQDLIGQFQITRYRANPDRPFHEDTDCLGTYPSQQDAIEAAESWIRTHMPDICGLLYSNAAWRNKPASENQLRYLKLLGVPIEGPLTRGRASELIHLHKPKLAIR